MERSNITFVVEFILLGFSDLPNLRSFLFGIILLIYISIVIGNGLLIVITNTNPALQTPMYYFLGNFSFLEICYTSVTLPRLLRDIWTQKGNIPFSFCALQIFTFYSIGIAECLLLVAMAYDRYVAICKPLYYPLIMNHKKCVQLVIISWITPIPAQIGLTYQIFSLNFCGPNKLNHIFCDASPLLEAACEDTYQKEVLVHLSALCFIMIPFLLISISYVKIITTILKLPSTSGKSKAFSTCSSHLIVIFVFFGTTSIVYLRPKSSQSAKSDKLFAIFYAIVTPVLNPIIYSLRNKDVIIALRKLLLKPCHS
ncbi:olfactory receptor 10AG1-like [Sminthopsis crassicaudata]|uniref:olfactory receptor 10AG1-like n=1 Tax=Sminthopsis crassicaudata TaxID=9301 RepID=UPI003D69632E